MTIAIGDRVALDAGATAARVTRVYDQEAGGSFIEAAIEQEGHPANGEVTLVRPGLYEVIEEGAEVKPVPVGQPELSAERYSGPQGKPLTYKGPTTTDRLDEYHTVTR
jgi:hypothetical protein